jgi:hypothetical protein
LEPIVVVHRERDRKAKLVAVKRDHHVEVMREETEMSELADDHVWLPSAGALARIHRSWAERLARSFCSLISSRAGRETQPVRDWAAGRVRPAA